MAIPISELFEDILDCPHINLKERYDSLFGIEEHKKRLSTILSILVDKSKLGEWQKGHHPDAVNLVKGVLRRPPLVILAGEVGSGKSEIAYTIGDEVARKNKIGIKVFPLSLSSRGQGRVGEMTQLISEAFRYTIQEASTLKGNNGKSKGAIILVVDEADALAQSRENSQMHHEDRAGVNAFIRGIDQIANAHVPAAVIMCTNRPSAIDPAVKRRAAEILIFDRPTAQQRKEAITTNFKGLNFSETIIESLVEATGARDGRSYGFTFSDITQRLIPSIVLDAYPDKPINPDEVLKIASTLIPTPPFKDNE